MCLRLYSLSILSSYPGNPCPGLIVRGGKLPAGNPLTVTGRNFLQGIIEGDTVREGETAAH